MGKVSVAWIAEAIAGKHGLTQKDAEQFVATFFDLINEALHELLNDGTVKALFEKYEAPYTAPSAE